MIRLFSRALIAIVVALTAVHANAGDFEIQLKAQAGERHVESAGTEQTPSAKPARRRPIIQLNAGQQISLSWQAENKSKSHEFQDVLMHTFVVEEERAGQQAVPKLTDDARYEGALTMDFKSHEKADWQMSLRIHEPGNYLVRVETIGMAQKQGHEHYAAIDLVVK